MIWAGLQALSLSSKIAICTTLCAALFSAGLYMGHQIGVSGCYEAQIKAQAHSIETGIKQAVVSDQTVTKYVDSIPFSWKNETHSIYTHVPLNHNGSTKAVDDGSSVQHKPEV